MSETQPLLAGGLPLPAGAVQHDHPIFLRVCHSSWRWLNQNILCYARGIVLAYLIAVTGMMMHYKVQKKDDHSDWRILFQFSTINWFMILAYHVMAFSWTLTHLHWPEVDPNDRSWESSILRLMQPPDQVGHPRRRFYFSVFYSLVHVYSFMLFVIFWTVLVPTGHGNLPKHPEDPDIPPSWMDPHFWHDIFADGWFKPYCIFHIYTFPAILAFIEIFFLNAIKRQVPVPSHIFSVMFLAGLYLGWAAVGKLLTGHDVFFWMNEKLAGSREAVAAYCVGFMALSVVSFSFMFGLIGMRDAIVERGIDLGFIRDQFRGEHPDQ